MNINKTIAARRSIRKFTEADITDDQVKIIIEAGMNAPSANDGRPWHFMVIKDRKTIDAMIQICPNGDFMKEAGGVLVVLGDLSINKDYFAIDCAASIQNILLSSCELGLGTCWIGVYPRESRIEGLKKLFSLPENIVPHSLIALGHPAEELEANNNYQECRVHREKW